MSIEENKEIARRYLCLGPEEAKRDSEAGKDDFHAPEFVLHGTSGDMNLTEFRTLMATMATAFPDFKYNAEDIIAEGDKVVTRYTFTGTNQGDFMGIPASGKKVKTAGISIIRIKDGKLVEGWFMGDALGMMQQIGAIPSQ